MSIDRNEVKRAIHRSQRCQRNWDLSRPIPDEDMELLVTAVSECPSKQNAAYYKVHFISNRDMIERVHACTDGFVTNFASGESVTNSQVLANLLVAFEFMELRFETPKDAKRNAEIHAAAHDRISSESKEFLMRDRQMAVGIAAGYLNVTASLLGYSTGCCLCFDADRVREIVGAEREILLLMGIGFKNEGVGRRLHHVDRSFVFPTKAKQAIPVKIVP